MTENISLGVGLLDEVGVLPALCSKELGKDLISAVIVALAVLTAKGLTGNKLVETLSSGSNISRLPALRPLIVPVNVLGPDKHHSIDGSATTKQTAGHVGDIVTVSRCANIAKVVAVSGNIVHGNSVVPRQALAASGSKGGTTALDQQDGLAALGYSLSSNNTGRTGTSNDVVVGGIGNGSCGVSWDRCGRVAAADGCARTRVRASASLDSHCGPSLELSASGVGCRQSKSTKAVVVVQSSRGRGRISGGSRGEGPADNVGAGGLVEDHASLGVFADTVLAKESV